MPSSVWLTLPYHHQWRSPRILDLTLTLPYHGVRALAASLDLTLTLP